MILDERRFWSKVEKTDGCWMWAAAKNNMGYGIFAVSKRDLRLAHRVSYELTFGPIPEGLVVDHVRKRGCVSSACVNPDHLEAVTQAINVMRSKRDFCPQGHPYDGENTYIRPSTGHRECRECNRARHRKAGFKPQSIIPDVDFQGSTDPGTGPEEPSEPEPTPGEQE